MANFMAVRDILRAGIFDQSIIRNGRKTARSLKKK
jgi:hypothetical protein